MAEGHARAAQRGRRFDRGHDAERPVEYSAVWNGVQVGPGGDRRKPAIGPRNHPEEIAPPVHPDLGPGLAHPARGEAGGLGMLRAVGKARHAPLDGTAHRPQRGQTRVEPILPNPGSRYGRTPPIRIIASADPRSL